MKTLNTILNIVMGAFVGVFIGRSVFTVWDFKTSPELYAIQSAPWYTSILVSGALTVTVVVICLIIKAIIKRHIKKSENKN